MNGLRDDNVVLDVLENDHTSIYGLDKRLEDRQVWVSKLKKRLVTISANRNNNNNRNIWLPSIYRIPMCIREVNPVAYEPQVLLLGPYHYGKLQLQAMDELKWCYFQIFLNRNPEKDLDDYLTLVEVLESQARSAYSELEPNIDSKDFIQMMLLDCCFLLEFLQVYLWEQGGGEEDNDDNKELLNHIRNLTWAMPFVLRDILLLENQLPFFLLKRLLELNIPHQTPSLPQIVHRVFWDLMPGKIRKIPTNMDNIVDVPIHHILHLMYSCTIPISVLEDHPKSSSPEDNPKSPLSASLPCLFKMFPQGVKILRRLVRNHHPTDDTINHVTAEEPTLLWIPCAKKLKEAGVVFKRKRDYISFLDVTFNRGIMEIPPLQIFGYIDSVFRNLIAFEQCHTFNYSPLYISSYAYLMNFVIDTPADVQLLKQEGIIVSTLGNDDDVANLFNQLRKNTTIDSNCCHMASVFDDVLLHRDKRANRWKATLNHNYFSNPWAIISVVAAIFLFVLTIMQAVLAFFSYLRPIKA